MARPIRIERAGNWYHISARGNERRPIFWDDRDRQRFCGLLAELVARFNLVLHAFVLMDNHYHLLLELREANLSRAMQWLNVSYGVWFNRRHLRVGHLFQGRYHGVIVEAPVWGLRLSRYLHLNPVRVARLGQGKRAQRSIHAGVSDRPTVSQVRERIEKLRTYRWSSYRAYAGLAAAPAWLECAAVLKLGGGGQETGRRKYRTYVEAALREGLQISPWEELREQVVLGSAGFLAGLRRHWTGDTREQRGVARLRAQSVDFAEVIRSVERVKGARWDAFRDRHGDPGRDLVLYLGRKACGLKLDDLAQRVGLREYAAVAVAVKRFTVRLERSGWLRAQYQQVLRLLNVKM
ncbi:MAG: transposase [Verrucomicrobia bacterium]|nr:transposase [Verrucomicrobiota bacterium]